MTIVEDSRLTPMKILDLFRERLKIERQRLGLTQAELGAAGSVDRRTQYKYEVGTNEPNISYLKGVESAGVDIPFALFGQRSEELSGVVDWPLLWQAVPLELPNHHESHSLPPRSGFVRQTLPWRTERTRSVE